jgi:hypothetical protein
MKKIIFTFLVVLTVFGCTSKPKEEIIIKEKPDPLFFTLNGQQYELPTSIESFTDNGWILCDFDFTEEEINLGANEAYQTRYCNGYHSIYIYLANSTTKKVAIHEATVIGVLYDARIAGFLEAGTPRMDIPDELIEINGVNLGTTLEEAKELWMDSPNFESDTNSVSYYISSKDDSIPHKGFAKISYIFGGVNEVNIFTEDVSSYNPFVIFDDARLETNARKSYAIPASDNYNTPSNIYYGTAYLKATIIKEETFYYISGDYSDKFNGYLVEDEFGQQFAILIHTDDISELVVGQEYEFWGMPIDKYHTSNKVSIIGIDIFYINTDGTEIYNIEYYVE